MRWPTGTIDVVFSKWVVNEHRYSGRGIYAGEKPDDWLRTIAWLPQEDRFLFAMAPWTGIESFEQLVAEKPVLHMAGSGAEVVLREYGFSYADIEQWGGSVSHMDHTARAAKARYDAGQLDAFWGDGSAYDFSAWPWVGSRGYRFLDISEEVMQRLEAKGLRRQVTPAGFVPGVDKYADRAGRLPHRPHLPRRSRRRTGVPPGERPSTTTSGTSS